eukprot:CAMPEP_0114694286 /NCGR_PEP_ID=MMETSP0191-20121206/70007_1 /TAXON_ID=126664 /ORGANISM="Sorites sp." /LENGTH=238 /DNA_ID=CAMNT_0001988979 /DNA_START=666 /DNA_END=1382 /DNA_ORIENTATION=+
MLNDLANKNENELIDIISSLKARIKSLEKQYERSNLEIKRLKGEIEELEDQDTITHERYEEKMNIETQSHQKTRSQMEILQQELHELKFGGKRASIDNDDDNDSNNNDNNNSNDNSGDDLIDGINKQALIEFANEMDMDPDDPDVLAAYKMSLEPDNDDDIDINDDNNKNNDDDQEMMDELLNELPGIKADDIDMNELLNNDYDDENENNNNNNNNNNDTNNNDKKKKDNQSKPNNGQ